MASETKRAANRLKYLTETGHFERSAAGLRMMARKASPQPWARDGGHDHENAWSVMLDTNGKKLFDTINGERVLIEQDSDGEGGVVRWDANGMADFAMVAWLVNEGTDCIEGAALMEADYRLCRQLLLERAGEVARLRSALQAIVDDDDASVSLTDQRARWNERMREARDALAATTPA